MSTTSILFDRSMYTPANTPLPKAPRRRTVDLPFEERGDQAILTRVSGEYNASDFRVGASVEDVFTLGPEVRDHSITTRMSSITTSAPAARPVSSNILTLTSDFASIDLKRHSMSTQATTASNQLPSPPASPQYATANVRAGPRDRRVR